MQTHNLGKNRVFFFSLLLFIYYFFFFGDNFFLYISSWKGLIVWTGSRTFCPYSIDEKLGFDSLICVEFHSLGMVSSCQGGHALWKTGKTGKMVKKYSLQGKIREFEILLKNREKSGNFKKSYLCKVKIFKFYSCSDVAFGGFFLPYA